MKKLRVVIVVIVLALLAGLVFPDAIVRTIDYLSDLLDHMTRSPNQ